MGQLLQCTGWSRFGSVQTGSAVFSAIPIQVLPVRRFGRFAGSAGSPVQPVLKKVLFKKRCAPRFHAECTGHCVESFHEEPIREKNVIFKKVASWYPGIPVRGSASSLSSRFAGSHPFTGSPIRFASVFPVPGSRFRSGSEPCCPLLQVFIRITHSKKVPSHSLILSL